MPVLSRLMIVPVRNTQSGNLKSSFLPETFGTFYACIRLLKSHLPTVIDPASRPRLSY